MIKINLCLSDLPKDKIRTSGDKKYIDIVVDSRKEVDKYGHTLTVYVNQTKEEREAKQNKTYVGNGKEYIFGNNNQQQNTYQPPTPTNTVEDTDDLPF